MSFLLESYYFSLLLPAWSFCINFPFFLIYFAILCVIDIRASVRRWHTTCTKIYIWGHSTLYLHISVCKFTCTLRYDYQLLTLPAVMRVRTTFFTNADPVRLWMKCKEWRIKWNIKSEMFGIKNAIFECRLLCILYTWYICKCALNCFM